MKASRNFKRFRKLNLFKYSVLVYKLLLIIYKIFPRQMLRELIPGDLVKVQSSNDWKRSIIAAYNQDAGEILFQLYLSAFYTLCYVYVIPPP